MSNEELIRAGAGVIVRRHNDLILCKYKPKGYNEYWDIHCVKYNKLISITRMIDNIYDEPSMTDLFFKYCKGFKP